MPLELVRALPAPPHVLVLDLVRMLRRDHHPLVAERYAGLLAPTFELGAVRVVALLGDHECG